MKLVPSTELRSRHAQILGGTQKRRFYHNPEWIDIYAITKNAFVFGEFDQIVSAPDGLKVYALSGQAPEDVTDFDDLYAYYADLFGSSPPEFNIVPPPDSPEDKIMGGSGMVTVAASFDQTSFRDWQLLSHHLFHAFYDNAAPYVNVHITPNIWLNEGLAAYTKIWRQTLCRNRSNQILVSTSTVRWR